MRPTCRAALPSLLAAAGDTAMTLAEVRQHCAAVEPAPTPAPDAESAQDAPDAGAHPLPGVVRQRLADDCLAADRPFSVIAHRPNYFLFATFVFEREHWALAFKPWIWISPDKDYDQKVNRLGLGLSVTDWLD